MSVSLVQRSLRKIAIFEAYYGDIVSSLCAEPVKEEIPEPPKIAEVRPEIVIEAPPPVEELFPEKVVRKFALLDQLEEISMKELLERCREIARQL